MKKTYAFNSMNGDRTYNADDIASDKAIFYSDGVVIQGGGILGTQLQVSAVSGMQVKVNNGIGIIQGRTVNFYGTADGSEAVTLDTADATYDRIDRVVLELNLGSGIRDITAKVVKGTPASSPTAPSLTRNETVYQISLAQVRVVANTSTVGTITDERSNATVCGISNVRVGISGNEAVTISISNTAKTLYGLDTVNANVEKALIKAFSLSSYMAFCTNANTNSLDAAFGKNNEDKVMGLGMQLAMYAWFKGTVKATSPFTNLIGCDTFANILQNGTALAEFLNDDNLYNLMVASPYALATFGTYDITNAVSVLSGFSAGTYTTIASLSTNATNFATVVNHSKGGKLLFGNKYIFDYLTSDVTKAGLMYNAIQAQGEANFIASSYCNSTYLATRPTYGTANFTSSCAAGTIIRSTACFCIEVICGTSGGTNTTRTVGTWKLSPTTTSKSTGSYFNFGTINRFASEIKAVTANGAYIATANFIKCA